MPDITMCKDADCPQRHLCRRSPESGTVPSEWQSWYLASPREGEVCRLFMPDRGKVIWQSAVERDAEGKPVRLNMGRVK